MSTSIQLFGDSEVATKTTVKGATSASYVTKKAYGIAHSLKGSALTVAHEKYRVALGVAGNQGLSSLLAGGQWLTQKITNGPDGDTKTVVLRNANCFESVTNTNKIAELEEKAKADEATIKAAADKIARLEAEAAEYAAILATGKAVSAAA